MTSGRARRLRALGLLLIPLLPLGACSAPGSDDLQPDAPPEESLLHDLRRPVDAGPTVLVRVHSSPGEHGFVPVETHLPEGGSVRFVMTGVLPDAVVFDTSSLLPAGRRFLRERGIDRGPLFSAPGQTFDLDLTDAPDGRYPYGSLLHAPSGATGTIIIGHPAESSEGSS